MSSAPFFSNEKAPGFSLMELLLAVAIIGMLAALLFPLVGRLRQTAKAAQCTGNLRQIGAGFFNYANEHNNRLPPPIS